jgi:hypothetical protein
LKHTDNKAAVFEEIAGALGADSTLDFIALLRCSRSVGSRRHLVWVAQASRVDKCSKKFTQANESRLTCAKKRAETVPPAFHRRRHRAVTGAQ